MKRIHVLLFVLIASVALFSCGGGGGGGGGGGSADPAGSESGTPAPAEEVAISNLSTYLAAKPANDAGSAYKIKITGLTTTNCNDIPKALTANSSKFVDLSATTLPGGITNMINYFYGCKALVQAPAIPNGVTFMFACFYGCKALVQAPVIPSSVTSMDTCFEGCTSLKTVQINTTVCTIWDNCFYNCTSITSVTVPSQTVKDAITKTTGNGAVEGKITIK